MFITFSYIGIKQYIEKSAKYSLSKCDPLIYSLLVILILHELFYIFYYYSVNKKLEMLCTLNCIASILVFSINYLVKKSKYRKIIAKN